MKKFRFLAVIAAFAALWACKPDVPEVTPEIGVSPATVNFEADGGTLRVAVTTNMESYEVTGAPEWLTVQQNGNEIALTAAANTVNAPRNCTLTAKAGSATATIEVSQKAGSPYPGFTVASACKLEYAGTMLYQFIKPVEGYDGGQGYLEIDDEDGNHISAWIYTELFMSAEEVNLTPGTYTKGEDIYPTTLVAKKNTYMPGTVYSLEGEDEEPFVTGTIYKSAATGEEIPLVEGTILVSTDGESNLPLVKVDMKDANGKEYKFIYIGEVAIDTEGATYPGTTDRIDVAATIFGATCYWNGDKYENGTASFTLTIYSGDPDDPAITNYEFNTAYVDYSEDIDLSGAYRTPSEPVEGEEPVEPLSAGTIIPGALVELFPGFEMPMGTYVMYSFGDYVIGDAFDSLVLEKQADGTYNFTGAIMSSAGEFVMFLGIEGLEIPIVNGLEEED